MDQKFVARAKAILRSGPATETELAAALFGSSGNPAPWVSMLGQMLSGNDKFERDKQGVWSLRAAPQREPLILAGRRTRARGGRLAAIAVAPISSSTPIVRWSFLTEGHSPAYLKDSLGADLDEAVWFHDVAEQLSTLLADRKLFTLDSRLISCIEREYERLGLVPSFFDSEAVSPPVPERGRKPTILDMRIALGLQPYNPDELLSELEVVAALYTGRLHEHGAPVNASGGDSRPRLRFQASELPTVPGVYSFLDAEAHPLYIGSASNLRRRVLSYFGEQIELTRGMRGLLERTNSLETCVFGTHVEAVVVEAHLIERYQPPFNVQLSQHLGEAWIRIGTEYPLNVIQVVSKRRDDGAQYVGPYSSRKLAADIAALAAVLWHLPRRGARKRVDQRSVEKRDQLAGTLRDTSNLGQVLRRQLSMVSGTLTLRERADLLTRLETVERALEEEPGHIPMIDAANPRLVWRYSEAEGFVYVCLLINSRCGVSARFPLGDHTRALRVLEELEQVVEESRDGENHTVIGSDMVVSRWLYLHRKDVSVLRWTDDRGDLCARLVELAAGS